MKSLLVASVYGPTRRNAVWYRLQRSFLNKTTEIDYDFAVVLNEVSPSLVDSDVHVILHRPRNHGHLEGLQAVLQYCRTTDHDYYLFLDSDCFPVMANWLDILIRQMEQFGKEYAAPVRFENLDSFPHPCAFFTTAQGLRNGLTFTNRECTTLLGERTKENQFNEISFLPLLRSNVYSPHPVWGSIYHHLFYHHGAGTRVARTRSTTSGYFAHYVPEERHQESEREMFRALRKDPDGYVASLMHGAAHVAADNSGSNGSPRLVGKVNGFLQQLMTAGFARSR